MVTITAVLCIAVDRAWRSPLRFGLSLGAVMITVGVFFTINDEEVIYAGRNFYGEAPPAGQRR